MGEVRFQKNKGCVVRGSVICSRPLPVCTCSWLLPHDYQWESSNGMSFRGARKPIRFCKEVNFFYLLVLVLLLLEKTHLLVDVSYWEHRKGRRAGETNLTSKSWRCTILCQAGKKLGLRAWSWEAEESNSKFGCQISVVIWWGWGTVGRSEHQDEYNKQVVWRTRKKEAAGHVFFEIFKIFCWNRQ